MRFSDWSSYVCSSDLVERAAEAVTTATLASPYDEIARVDRAAVLVAQGHEDAAREYLSSAVHNRSDDHMAPIELPLTTMIHMRRPHGKDVCLSLRRT